MEEFKKIRNAFTDIAGIGFPEIILKAYDRVKFITMNDIPVLGGAWDFIEHKYTREQIALLPFKEYENGFLTGVKEDFNPYIDTPETKREMIINEIFKRRAVFPGRINLEDQKDILPTPEQYFEYGIQIGRLYKAWSIVFDNPKYFQKDFENRMILPKSKTRKLTVKQIALIHVYERNQITRGNASEIALKHGYKSGEGLFQDYTYYGSHANRKGDPGTAKKLQNKIILFESITELINDKAKEWAFDEIKILKTLYKTEY